MLVEIQALKLACLGDSQSVKAIEHAKHDHGYREGGAVDTEDTDRLCFQDLKAAAVKEACQSPARRSVSGWDAGWAAPACAVLAAGKEAQRKRAPHAVESMHGPCADRIVDPQVFKQIDAQDHQDSGDSAQGAGARGANPVARAGDSDQPGEEAVGDNRAVPFF